MKDDLRIFLLLLKHLKMYSGFVHTENICVNPAWAVILFCIQSQEVLNMHVCGVNQWLILGIGMVAKSWSVVKRWLKTIGDESYKPALWVCGKVACTQVEKHIGLLPFFAMIISSLPACLCSISQSYKYWLYMLLHVVSLMLLYRIVCKS